MLIFKNLLRRKVRTLLTLIGVAIGVVAILSLGAMADGVSTGYNAVLQGANADYTLGAVATFDLSLAALDETILTELTDLPEVASASALLQGLVQSPQSPYFYVFAYPQNTFGLDRFEVIAGEFIYGSPVIGPDRPVMLGSAAAQAYNLGVGDRLRLSNNFYRITGIYETGDAFETGGAVLQLSDAQDLLGKDGQVSVFYIRLRDANQAERFENRIAVLYPNLLLSSGRDLGTQGDMAAALSVMLGGIAFVAILLGGIGMTNTQLMAVMERTREIGVLRAVGWSRWRILRLILGESLVVSMLGGVVGIILSWLILTAFYSLLVAFGASPNLSPSLILQAVVVVIALGLLGGAYPAWRASQMQPIEALRYEGGSSGENATRIPFGGLVMQNLTRRRSRTVLTLIIISVAVGSVVTIQNSMVGVTDIFNAFIGSKGHLMVRQADAADLSVAFLDESIGQQIATLPEVQSVSGIGISAVLDPQLGPLVVQGMAPNSASMLSINVITGTYLTKSSEIMLGLKVAQANNVQVGQRFSLNGESYRIVGIYTSNVPWEELGMIVHLRTVQGITGQSNKVTYFNVLLHNPTQAEQVADQIEAHWPDVAANLPAELSTQLPDLQNSNAMSDGLAVIALVIGTLTVMNTMLMSVFERTREIGVLRALGWRQRAVLSLIIRESVILAVLGGSLGIGMGLVGLELINNAPLLGELMDISPDPFILIRALVLSAILGILGGIYPAWQATRLQPVEALRYE